MTGAEGEPELFAAEPLAHDCLYGERWPSRHPSFDNSTAVSSLFICT